MTYTPLGSAEGGGRKGREREHGWWEPSSTGCRKAVPPSPRWDSAKDPLISISLRGIEKEVGGADNVEGINLSLSLFTGLLLCKALSEGVTSSTFPNPSTSFFPFSVLFLPFFFLKRLLARSLSFPTCGSRVLVPSPANGLWHGCSAGSRDPGRLLGTRPLRRCREGWEEGWPVRPVYLKLAQPYSTLDGG